MPILIRHTKQRQAVLRAVKLSAQALTAEEIHVRVRGLFPEMSLATIYRGLDFFSKRGEIYRIEGDDGIKRYIGHAFHEVKFRCQRCGQVRELPSDTLQDYVNRKMWGKQTVFFSRLTAQGLCAACLRALGRDHPSATRRPSLSRRGQ